MEYVFRALDLSKAYKGKLVLDKVNMNIERGDIYGFVGENGSGKTTVIRLITGLIFEKEGSFELFGVGNKDENIRNARKKIGAIVESPSIYTNMSAYDNLKMQRDILGLEGTERIEEAIEAVGLSYLIGDKKAAGNYSLGMRQRLGIAMALLGEPEFLLLDEPMNGLDPAGIVELRELIIRLNREKNITFLISSHILTELSLVATKYGIISKGRIIKEISAEQLKNECRHSVVIGVDDKEALFARLSEKHAPADLEYTVNGVRIYGNYDLNSVLLDVISSGISIKSVNSFEANIEDYYLSLIGGANNA